jgi:type IV pilus assembly protein PilE
MTRRTDRPGIPGRDTGRGFTLIELMIVVAVIAIITIVAFPAYNAYIERARRSDARNALMEAASRQQQFRVDNKTFGSALASIGYLSSITPDGFYVLSLGNVTNNTFTMTATATGPQLRDEKCRAFRITQTGSRTALDSGSADNTDECW